MLERKPLLLVTFDVYLGRNGLTVWSFLSGLAVESGAAGSANEAVDSWLLLEFVEFIVGCLRI